MRVLEHLEPKKVFYYFEEICGIPHPSYKEQKISDYLVDFAREHRLEYIQDELGNVIMIAPATTGYEDAPAVILQGHMDMVCEKEPGCDIDFETEGLRLVVEGDCIRAEGTTLGGDDGIAVAVALAILDSPDISHPRLEVVLTVSEEVGMEGAAGIDLSMLTGRRLINIDSEQEGILTVGCAGGNSTVCFLPIEREERAGELLSLRLTGLLGGHSGIEIDKGRANASLLLGRLLGALCDEKIDVSLVSMSGGAKQNVIPREASCVLVCAHRAADSCIKALQKELVEIRTEYETTDPNISLEINRRPAEKVTALTTESMHRIVELLAALPAGIQTMSADIKELVETSLNLGILKLEEHSLRLEYSVRSLMDAHLRELSGELRSIVTAAGGSVEVSGSYPAWEYKKDSPLREDALRIFTSMYGYAPKVETVHAGLECGILAAKLPGLDAISIGPNLQGIHTVEETLSISSAARVYEYVVELLALR